MYHAGGQALSCREQTGGLLFTGLRFDRDAEGRARRLEIALIRVPAVD